MSPPVQVNSGDNNFYDIEFVVTANRCWNFARFCYEQLQIEQLNSAMMQDIYFPLFVSLLASFNLR